MIRSRTLAALLASRIRSRAGHSRLPANAHLPSHRPGRRAGVAAVTAVLAVSALITTATPAKADVPLAVWLVNQNTGLCLAVAGAAVGSGGTAGAQVIQWQCNSNPDKLWHSREVSPGAFQISNDGGLCLTARSGDMITVDTCGNGYDVWAILVAADGSVRMVAWSGNCLALAGGDGGVILWPCDNPDSLDKHWLVT